VIRFKWTSALTAGIALLSLLAACGGGGGEETIDLGDGNSVSVGGDLPDDFPDDFPVYDGADFQGAVQAEAEGVEGTAVTWTTGDDYDDVVSFYEAAFDGGSWTSSSNGSAAGTKYWLVDQADGDQVGYVAVTEGDGVSIIATIGDDPNEASADGSSDDGNDSADEASSDPDEGSSDTVDDSSDGSSDGSDSSSDVDLPDEIEIPDEYPSDLVHVPDGARVTLAQTYSANGQTTYMVGFMTEKSAADAGDELDANLTGQGYAQTIKTTDANGYYAAYSENADGSGTIIAVSVSQGSYDGYQDGIVQVTTGL
jgi:hypothetical protein